MDDTFSWDVATPPIFFTYNGQPSTAFLHTWQREEASEATDGGRVRHCSWVDPATRLRVAAHIRTFSDFPAVEWVLELANDGVGPTPIIEDIRPLDLDWQRPAGQTIMLHYANGSKCVIDDFLPHTEQLDAGQNLALDPVGGRSSDGVLPFMNLQGAAGGCIVGIGWSGQWHAEFDRGEGGLRVRAGMERTHLRLHPDEQIRTPRILLIPWHGDDAITGNNLLRRLLLAHYCPRIDGELAIPPVAHMTMSTFHRTGWTDEAAELDALERAAPLGVEAFWVDACWYGAGGKWFEEVGTWTVRADSFPRGLRPIGDAAHDAGMKFVLWVEPERVRQGTALERDHPEWLLRPHDSTADWIFNAPENSLFNLGLPEARVFLTDLLSGIIADAGVDIYRQDFNIQPLPYWRAADAPDRVGMTEIRYVEGLYALWDELRQRHPGLAIDNCASGGRRIDLETTMRAFPLWRSDFSDVGGPEHGQRLQSGDQSQTAGLSRWVPLHSAAVWTFTPYACRSAMSSGVVLYCDIRVDTFPAEAATRAIAELKRLRPYFLGDFYPLLPLSVADDDWCAYQFDRPADGDGFAVFLRRHGSTVDSVNVSLQGIDPGATYEVGMTEQFDDPPRSPMAGSELARLPITLADRPGSLLLLYRKVDA